MLTRIWFGFFVAAFAGALYQWLAAGDAMVFTRVVQACFDMAKLGVEIAIGLIGVLCLWLGLFKVAERAGLVTRLARLVDASLSYGLPGFLTATPGINSGFMMVQVSAAALVSEAKTLSHPASVDSIPTSATQEDHVSMSTWAARKLDLVATLLERVLGMELLAAAQGIELRRPKRSSNVLEAVIERLRTLAPHLDDDRFMAGDMAEAASLVEGLAEVLREV